MTLFSNPRIIILLVIILIIPAASLLILILINILFGLLLLAFSIFIDWILCKFIIPQLKAKIVTSKEKISFFISKTETEEYPWKSISHSGYCTKKWEKPFIFVYDSLNDKLVTIPKEYTNFDLLQQEIKEKTDFIIVKLDKNKSIENFLECILNK